MRGEEEKLPPWVSYMRPWVFPTLEEVNGMVAKGEFDTELLEAAKRVGRK